MLVHSLLAATAMGVGLIGASALPPQSRADVSSAPPSVIAAPASAYIETSVADARPVIGVVHPLAPNANRVAAVQRRIVAPTTTVISVLCDSVGNDPGEWVSTWAKTLSATRTVTVRHYSYVVKTGRVEGTGWSPTPEVFETDSYSPLPPLTIWNFGWPGGTPATALAHLAEAIPQRPDVIFYSYGHNLGPATTETQYRTLHQAIRSRFPAAATAATLAHLTPVARPGQVTARSLLGPLLGSLGVAVIDERRVLPKTTLYKDAVHPNYPGYALLAQRVRAALLAPTSALNNPVGPGSLWLGRSGATRLLALRDARGTVVPYAAATLVYRGTTTVLESDATGIVRATLKPGTRITMTDGVVTAAGRA